MAAPVTIFPDNTCWVKLTGEASVQVVMGSNSYGIGMQGDGFPVTASRFVRIPCYDARTFVTDGFVEYAEPFTLPAAERATARFWAE